MKAERIKQKPVPEPPDAEDVEMLRPAEVVELERLRVFYTTVCKLTIDHRVIAEDYAAVYPSDLGDALEKVNSLWYKDLSSRLGD